MHFDCFFLLFKFFKDCVFIRIPKHTFTATLRSDSSINLNRSEPFEPNGGPNDSLHSLNTLIFCDSYSYFTCVT